VLDEVGMPVAMNRQRVTTVQIAIEDRGYAEELRRLLMADGQHQVYVVNYPSPAIDGVVVMDDTIAIRMKLAVGFDFGRCVVFTQKVPVQVDQLWEAGVRHVIHADYPPHTGRLVVLAAERRLDGSAVVERELSIFDETDRLFLQALRISDS
jgi:hypothetical protein